MIVGITGHIGSGKSEVARVFREHGAYIISADKIGKRVVERNSNVLSKIVQEFGYGILNATYKLNRRKLGKIVFSNKNSKKKLDSIVHPVLLRELKKALDRAVKINDLIIIDAALLVDWGWEKNVDKLILVDADDSVKIGRLTAKGYTEAEAKMRLDMQISTERLKEAADIVVTNNDSVEELRTKVEKILKELVQKG
jgi:dephospho-CoA kinase